MIRGWVTLILVACVTTSCASLSTSSMQYVGAPRLPPTDPTSVQILQAIPAQPHNRLGEISVTASTAPAPPVPDLEARLRQKAGALGADAVVVVYDSLQPIGAYASGGWWADRTVYTVTGRRLIAVAIKYQALASQAPSAAVADTPGVVYAERASATGTVESIDQSKRTVTLKRSDGQSITFKAPPEARNFDQIRRGDSVRAEYLDAVAIFVRKATGPPQAGETATVAVAPKDANPQAVLVDTVELTAKVEAVDYDNRTVTLRGPQGTRRVVKVDARVQRLNEVKPGDEVVVRHTEAIALAFSK